MENFEYYIFCIVAFIVVFLLVKKITGCLIKTAIFVVLAAVLAAIYYLWLS